MAGRRNNVTLYAISGGIALYILCKRGYIKSGICNLFKPGIPGLTFGGGGGLVEIGSDTIQLSVLLDRWNQSGQGLDQLKNLQPGDLIPDPLRPIGSRAGSSVIVGFIRNSRPDLNQNGRVLQYLVKRPNDQTAGMINPPDLKPFRQWVKVV